MMFKAWSDAMRVFGAAKPSVPDYHIVPGYEAGTQK